MMISVSAITLVSCLLSFDALDLLVEPLEPVAPDLAVPLDPIGRLFQWRHLETAGSPLCLAAASDQPGPLEHLEVLGNRLETDRERPRQLIDRGFTFGQPGENRTPGRIG
jgi:hypothetical protein